MPNPKQSPCSASGVIAALVLEPVAAATSPIPQSRLSRRLAGIPFRELLHHRPASIVQTTRFAETISRCSSTASSSPPRRERRLMLLRLERNLAGRFIYHNRFSSRGTTVAGPNLHMRLASRRKRRPER